MSLSVIIVSYNTKALTLNCLSALSGEIIVVDNASKDGSVDAIKSQYPLVKIIQNTENRGFAQANNQGAKLAQGDFFLFLNSDTEFSEENFKCFIRLIETNEPDIASIKLLNPNGSIQPQGGNLPNRLNVPLWMLNLDFFSPPYQERRHHPANLEWVGGTAMIVKKSVFTALNGFDEQIFMYAEDLDFCWRAKAAGYRVSYFPDCTVTHLGQGSGAPDKAILGEYRGLLYLFGKFRPRDLPYLKFWLKVGALLRFSLFGMMGQHEKSQAYRQAFALV